MNFWKLALGVAAALLAASPTLAQDMGFADVAVVSQTMGINDGRICTGEFSRGDIGCASNAPYVSRTSGFLGIGTATPSTTLHVSGTLRIANGGEACDASRAGAIRYTAAGQFQTCYGSGGWATLSSAATSGTLGVVALSSLTDVSVTSPSSGQVLSYSGGRWVNSEPVTGTISISGTVTSTVAFSVHRNGTTQTLVGSDWNTIVWTTEEYDTNANFASNRFTPTVSGKYLINAGAYCDNGVGPNCGISIFKNGAEFASNWVNGNYGNPDVNALVDLNGSTDYLEVAVKNEGGTTLSGLKKYTYFQGVLQNGGGGWSGSAALGDRIISGTSGITVQTGGVISITTNGVTANYFNTSGQLITPGIGVGIATPSVTLQVSGSMMAKTAPANDNCTADEAGAIRYNSITKRLQICRQPGS